MGRKNPVAKALRKLRHKVIPNKKRKEHEDDPVFCNGCGNERPYCVCKVGSGA